MNSITKPRQLIRLVLLLPALLLLLAAAAGQAQVILATNFFSGTITLDGDISQFFFPGTTTPLPGVCVRNDDADPITGVPGSTGLGGLPGDASANEPNNTLVQSDQSQKHPNGFNQRRIITAYNPNLNGGTIFVGLDLPGGTGSAANPNFDDSGFGFLVRGGVIKPFDSDGNGDPETIGLKADGVTPLVRCSDAIPGAIVDILSFNGLTGLCNGPPGAQADGFSDFASDGQEIYSVTIVFGPDPFAFTAPKVTVNYIEDSLSFTPTPGRARMEVLSANAAAAFGARISTSTSGVGNGSPLGVDVEFMITNVNNAVPDACLRFQQNIRSISGSNVDAGNGEDQTSLQCVYTNSTGCLKLAMTCPPPTNSPGSLFIFSGSVSNCGSASLANVIVVSDQPVFPTVVANIPILAGSQSVAFTGSFLIPATFKGCQIIDTLSVSGVPACGPLVTDSLTTTCSLTNSLRIGCPTDLLVECLEEVPFPDPNTVVIKENTGSPAVVIFVGAVTNAIGCTNIITRTYRATNDCGSAVCVQTITVVDRTKPVLVGVPPVNLSLQCPSDVPPQAIVTAMDNCDGPTPVTPGATTNVIGCTNIITRTWTAVDRCKNTNTATQLIIVVDTIPPQLSGVPPNQNFVCLSEVPAATLVTALDNCDGAVQVTPASSTNVIGCTNIITRIWTAFDRCKNTNVATQIITVVDTIKPDLLGVPPVNLSVQCLGDVPPPAVVTAMDNCDGPIPVTPGATTNLIGCTNIITRTWTAVDRCKNTNVATQIISVVDTIKPVLLGVPPVNLSLQCPSDVPAQAVVTAMDNCDGPVPVTAGASTNLIGCTNIITRTWTASDLCKNTNVATQIITVVDTIPPELTGVPPNQNFQCLGDVPAPALVGALDNCDGAVQVTPASSTNVIGCTNIITRTWTAFDRCKNTNVATQTITVVDTIKPDLLGVPPVNLSLQCPSDVPSPAVVTASDNCDGPLPVTVNASTNLIGCTNIITRTWIAVDRCKNTNSAAQIITVVDTIKPDLLGLPPVNLSLQCLSDVPPQAVVTAVDICDGPLPVTPGASTNVIGCTNIITRTWTAFDRCRNTNTATQIITVVDTIAPQLSGVPPNQNFQCLSDVPAPALVNALDNCDGAVQVTPASSTNVIGCTNIITRTWTAFDRCKNTNVATQTITVVDTIKPDLLGLPPVNLSLQCPSDVPPQAVVTAIDNCDGPIPVTPGASTNVVGCTNFITRTWTAVDRCRNTNSATQLITVVDTMPPQLVGVPPNQNFQCLNDVPFPAIVTALDNCDGFLTATLTSVTNGTTCPIIITNMWQAVDRCRNTNRATQIIRVQDTIRPVIVGVPPSVNVECLNDVPVPAILTATDNCDPFVPVTFTSVTNGTGCPIFVTNMWMAVDLCHNTNTATQVIVVRDTVPPVITCPTNLLVFLLGQVPPCPTTLAQFLGQGGTARDNCDTNLAYSCANGPTNVNGCITNFIRTHTVTDRCGNSASCPQLITIQSCPPSICVIKEVACVLPGGACGPFSDVATGFKSASQNPAFCYRFTVTNCGTVALNNLRVIDDHLGDITAFFTFPGGQLPVGGSVVSSSIRRAWPTNTINTVIASGTSVIDGTPASSTDSAMAVVLPASMNCSVLFTSPDDLDGNALDNHVQLMADNIPHSVTLSITVSNTGAADLASVTISAPALSQLGCVAPVPFNLPAGGSSTFTCTASFTCLGADVNILSVVNAVVDTQTGHCGFDINGNRVTVTSDSLCNAQLVCRICPTNCGSITLCDPLYPYNSANPLTSVDFNESEVLRTNTVTLTNGCVPSQIRVFYNDEHALTLGVRRLIVKNSAGAGGTVTTDFPFSTLGSSPDSTLDPLVGDPNATDEAGRPLFPAIFVTDITADPLTCTPGHEAGCKDWQFGGIAIPPHAVFGTWKGAVRTVDNTKNPATDTITPDVDPAKNNYNLGPDADPVPPGLVNQGYGAEVRWDTEKLGLLPGHTYRLYFMVHDGDQNHQGGDVGQGCATLVMGGQTDCGQSALGDFVWNDTNANGVQDVGEPGISGVTVELLDCISMNVLRTTTTGPGGLYLFTGLAPGTYKVRFTPPVGFSFTTPNANGNSVDATDSDAAPGTGLTGCYTVLLNQTNRTVDAGLVRGTPPGLLLIKSANPTLILPGGSVTYSYAVTNTGDMALANIVVTDDNGTPGFLGDDFMAGSIATLTPGAGTLFTVSKIVPQQMCGTVGNANVVIGTLTTEILANGNVKVTYLQSRNIVDNTYGANISAGWSRHAFKDLLGSDKAEFRFVNGNGSVVLDFFADYISASVSYPSGFGTLGVSGGEGSMVTGSANDVLSVTTTISDSLNQSPAFYGFTTDSPAPEANFPTWNYVDGYTVIVRGSVFGASGFGGVSIPLVHNSPAKVGSGAQIPVPCAACLTNIARATANVGNLTVMATDDARVCVELPPRLAALVMGETLTLAWDEASTGYRLQCAGTCSPSGNWTDMTNVPVVVNGQKTVQVPMSDVRQFYRLIKN